MMPVDPQTRRRNSGAGLTALDESRACPGYVLYAPMAGPGDVYLLDVNGTEVHHWPMPYPPGLYGYLLPNGNLFYGGKLRDAGTCDRFPSWKRFKSGVMLEADPDGRVVWEHRDPDHHHDARRTESGGALYLTVELMPAELAARVKGGIIGSAPEGMWSDVIVEVDAEGNRVWEWHAYEHLGPGCSPNHVQRPSRRMESRQHGGAPSGWPGNVQLPQHFHHRHHRKGHQ